MGREDFRMGQSIILAIETSSLVSSIAVLTENKLLAELNIETNKHHSENLIIHIQDLLKQAEIEKKDLSAIAVSTGPGSFTGLRIGLATAKTIAYTLRIPLIGISTLYGLAWNLYAEGAFVCPTMDAQKGNVYTSLLEIQNGILIKHWPEKVESIENILQEVKNNPAIMVLGEGVPSLFKLLEEHHLHSQIALPHLRMPKASSIGYAAMQRFLNKDFESLMEVVPNYIRKSEAEELWEKRQEKLDC